MDVHVRPHYNPLVTPKTNAVFNLRAPVRAFGVTPGSDRERGLFNS
jgi:hypothetical protein